MEDRRLDFARGVTDRDTLDATRPLGQFRTGSEKHFYFHNGKRQVGAPAGAQPPTNQV
jgi:hypothetical protein